MLMPSIGRIVSSSMQTPATTMRAPRGALRIRSSSMPGTPDALEDHRRPQVGGLALRLDERALARVDDDVRAHALASARRRGE